MRESTKAVSLVLIITLMLSALFFGINNASSAAPAPQAAPVVQCDLQVGQSTRVVCQAAGIVVLNTRIDVPTITLPPIRLPGTTETVTLPPRPNQTVTVPGPTTTVEVPGNTETVTSPPSIRSGPTETVTEEVTRQAPVESVTISPDTEPSDEAAPKDKQDIFFDFDEPVEQAVLGATSLLFLMALILLSMYMGYAIGYKDSDQENVRFLRALRDNVVSRTKS